MNNLFKSLQLPILIIKIFIVMMSLFVFNNYMYAKCIQESIPSDNYVIAHAMGGIDDISYTNSLEAFNLNYANGARYFEIDSSLSKDGYMVLWHDWGYSPDGYYDVDNIPTQQEFKNIKLLGKYTSLNLEDLKTILNSHNDVYFITDTKDISSVTVRYQFEQMISVFTEDELNHFIPQFYSEEMYYEIDSIHHFPSYIFTLYQIWDGTPGSLIDYCRFCIINNIEYLTMPYERYKGECIDIINNYDIKVWLHTVNSVTDARSFITDGIRGIYTDFIKNKDLEE